MLIMIGVTLAGMFFLGIYMYVIIKRLVILIFGDRGMGLQRGISIAAAVIVTLPVINLFSFWAMAVLHFAAISAVIDMVRLILRRTGLGRTDRRGSKGFQIACQSGAVAISITLAILGYAYFNMHRVLVTEYTVAAGSELREEGYRVIFLSDLHFGTTMDKEQLLKYCREMEDKKPDLVVLGGDIVDEATTLQEVSEAFKALGKIKSTYGTYYVYGNHDKGKYLKKSDFTEEELAETIRKSKVTILEDRTVLLNNELSISGRKDRSDAALDQTPRRSSKELLGDGLQAGFHIIVDHQPRDMDENEEAGFDLMLSGHTHGGQMWPVGLITTLFDHGTVNYGQKSFGDMQLIVSSGIAGWGYPLRTGKHSEFVVIDIAKK